jgi:hypothetical protein
MDLPELVHERFQLFRETKIEGKPFDLAGQVASGEILVQRDDPASGAEKELRRR